MYRYDWQSSRQTKAIKENQEADKEEEREKDVVVKKGETKKKEKKN